MGIDTFYSYVGSIVARTARPWPQVRFLFSGVTYYRTGWFGCQLASMEWWTVPAGTTRDLDFGDGSQPVTLTVFTTKRKGLRVYTTWAVSDSGTHIEHQRRILDLKARLAKLV